MNIHVPEELKITLLNTKIDYLSLFLHIIEHNQRKKNA